MSTAVSRMKPPRDLALIANAKRSLAAATSLAEVREIMSKADSLRLYLRKVGESFDVQQQAAEFCLRAKRRAGEIVGGGVRNGRPRKLSHDAIVSLEEAGVTPSQSSRWQAIASIDEPIFELYLEHARESGKEITSVGAYKLARKDSNHRNAPDPISHGIVSKLNDLIDLGAKFSTIYADPPWQYDNKATRSNVDGEYKSTMSVDEICAEPVPAILADDAHLHLWTTNGFLFDAKRVMESWGFTYKSCFVWVKPQMGIGNYWRVSHEFMLFGLRGKLPFADRGQKSWLSCDRTKHSRKPREVRALIEKVSPGPFLEMYGREVLSEPWTVYGNEIERDLF